MKRFIILIISGPLLVMLIYNSAAECSVHIGQKLLIIFIQ